MKLGMRSDSKGRTPFEQKWGMHVKELAKAECVGPEAIYMRVRNYGTPFQRHPKPSVEEIMYGRTVGELAKEKGCHPLTIKNRLKEHGTVHYESKMDHNLGRVYGDYHWAKGKRYTKPNGWLALYGFNPPMRFVYNELTVLLVVAIICLQIVLLTH